MPEQLAQRGMRAPNDQLSRQTLWGIGQSHKQNKQNKLFPPRPSWSRRSVSAITILVRSCTHRSVDRQEQNSYVVVKGGQKRKRVPAVGAGKLGLVGKLVQSGDCWTGINKWQHWVDIWVGVGQGFAEGWGAGGGGSKGWGAGGTSSF